MIGSLKFNQRRKTEPQVSTKGGNCWNSGISCKAFLNIILWIKFSLCWNIFKKETLLCKEFCERYKGHSVNWGWHTLFWIGFPASCDQRHSSRTRVNSVPVFTCKTEFSHCVCTLASCLQLKVQSRLQLVTLYDFVSLMKRRERRGENPRGDWVHLHRVPVGSGWLPVVTWFCGKSWHSTYWNWSGVETPPF